MKRFISIVLTLVSAGAAIVVIAAVPNPATHPVETGPAKFLRDHDKAMAEAKKSGKPVFAFFQEVPG